MKNMSSGDIMELSTLRLSFIHHDQFLSSQQYEITYMFYHMQACTITWSFASGIMSQFCGRCHTVFCDVAL